MKRRWRVLCLISFLLFLGGCSPLVKGEQTVSGGTVEVRPGHFIGQTFTAGYRGLTGIDVYLTPAPEGHRLALSLYSDPLLKNRLASASIHVQRADGAGYFRFSFPAIKDSTSADYYFDIQVEGNAASVISTGPGSAYLDGALYQDHLPQDAQLNFRLVYDPLQAILGLIIEALGWAWYGLLAGFLYLLPGWGLLSLLLGETWARRRWIEKLALSTGAGLALDPVLMLWAKLAHLRLGALYAWVPALLAGLYLLWKNRKNFSGRLFRLPRRPFRIAWTQLAPDLVFVLLFAAVLLVRFWVIRGVDVPLWGDSYQHTMIAQLIADQGGLFNSWQPYSPYQSLTVQYGFSSAAAAWMWLTGMSSSQAVLVFGQLLNALAILTLYPLAVLLARGNRWAGNAAVLLGGLLSAMPAMYVNWGRYAQLMGQVILPAALCLLWYWLEEGRFQWKQIPAHALVLSGLLLSYYRMAFYYAAFIPVLLALFWIRGPFGKNLRCWRTGVLKLAGVAALSVVLIAPWIPNVSGSHLSSAVEAGVTAQSPLAGVLSDYQVWKSLPNYVSTGLLLLVAASLVVSLLLKHWEVSGVIVWAGLISAVKAASLVHLPGATLMQSYMVLISLYIFVSIIGGWLIGWLIQGLSARFRRVGTAVALALFLAFTLYGLNGQRKIADPATYAIVTRPDLRAMDWIRAQTPRDAAFLVEGFRIYGGITAVGSDGGWWIPLLTARQNTMPPQYALTNEQPDPPDYTQRVVDLVAKLEARSPSDPALRTDLCQWGITHIYIGQKQGLASMEKIQLFPPNLDQSGPFRLVYAQDRVRIYAVPQNYCQGLALR